VETLDTDISLLRHLNQGDIPGLARILSQEVHNLYRCLHVDDITKVISKRTRPKRVSIFYEMDSALQIMNSLLEGPV